jgi:2-polyprenyl-3-methyl-5-hydroxy-6-metoxy-1,4-benzoquinol methylase
MGTRGTAGARAADARERETGAAAAAERVTLHPGSPWWGEHRSRYHFAGGFAAGKTVLDIACGTGFGGPILLASGAASVVGVDLSAEGLREARRELRQGFSLCQSDGTRLPLADGSIDLVTSFETLEHVPAYEALVAELERVLRPGGVLVLSTPNALHTRPVDGVPRNPFHVKEFLPEELRRLLARHFPSVEMLGQRTRTEYGSCPFWELPEHVPRDPTGRARTLVWKAIARLPAAARTPASRVLLGREFYPGEHDFQFHTGAQREGHVLVAVCRKGGGP